jgi:hypothetical protein
VSGRRRPDEAADDREPDGRQPAGSDLVSADEDVPTAPTAQIVQPPDGEGMPPADAPDGWRAEEPERDTTRPIGDPSPVRAWVSREPSRHSWTGTPNEAAEPTAPDAASEDAAGDDAGTAPSGEAWAAGEAAMAHADTADGADDAAGDGVEPAAVDAPLVAGDPGEDVAAHWTADLAAPDAAEADAGPAPAAAEDGAPQGAEDGTFADDHAGQAYAGSLSAAGETDAERAGGDGALPAGEAGDAGTAYAGGEAGAEPAVGDDAVPAAAGPAAAEPPAPGTGIWSSFPAPLRVAMGLVLFPVAVYVLIARSGWSGGVRAAAAVGWTAVLLAPVLLTHLPAGGRPPSLAIVPPALGSQGGGHETTVHTEVGAPAPAGAQPSPGHTPGPSASRGPSTAPSAAAQVAASNGVSPAPGPSAGGGPASTPAPTAQPPDATPAPQPTPAAPPATCGAPANPWGYNLCGGTIVTAEASGFCNVFNCAKHFDKQRKGYVALCADGSYGHDGGAPESCAMDGGETKPLYGP